MSGLACIVLAAGKGTRMRSSRPKVLHEVAGRALAAHVLANAEGLKPDAVCLVHGPEMAGNADSLEKTFPRLIWALQERRKGTADAVRVGLEALRVKPQTVLVLYGDTPLMRRDTLARLVAAIETGAGLALLGFEASDPAGYGRILTDNEGGVRGIREEADASPGERTVRLCNSGVMAFRADVLADVLPRIDNENAKGEYYLTDAVALAIAGAYRVVLVMSDETEVVGVNTQAELARAEALMQARLRTAAMAEGAVLMAPETVFLSHDTVLAADVIVEPNVVFRPGVRVESGAVIRAFSHLEGAYVRQGAVVGPFARLRPGSDIGPAARVGNFVEVKNTEMGEGAKANHLAYLGDAGIGPGANVGAGTITCNYDGARKHRTEIGAGAFIGSNSALVAPVRIGKGAYIGSGSVIVRDVGDDDLALARAPQIEKPGAAARMRARVGRDRKSE